MKARRLLPRLALAVGLAGGCLSSAAAAGESYVTFGADVTAAQRDAITQLAGLSAPVVAGTVSTPEMVDALRGTGVPVEAGGKSIASSIVTCLNPGEGLAVRTQNISRITPPVYAGALLVAGARDVRVLVAAPPDSPETGETALVGILKGSAHCQTGTSLDPARARLAQKQIAWAMALAGSTGDLNHSASLLLKAETPVAAGQAMDVAAISGAIDAAAASEGLSIDASLRPALVDFLLAFEHLDFGPYAKGASLQQPSPAEAKLVATEPPVAGSETAAELAGKGTKVGRHSGGPLTVRVNGHVFAWWQWSLPLFGFLAFLALVPLLALRSRDDDFILEPYTGGTLPPDGRVDGG